MGSPQPPPSPPTSPLPAAARQGRSLSPPAASWGRSSPPAAAAARRRAPPGTATARRAPGTAPPTASSGGLRGAMQEDSEKESSAAGSAVLGCTLLSARPAHLLIPLPPPVRAHTPSCPLFFFLINSSLVWVGLGHARILQRAGLERRDAGMGSGSQAARGGIQLPQPHSRALGPLPPRTAQPPYPMPCVLRGGGGNAAGGFATHRPLPITSTLDPPRSVPLLPLRVPLPSCSASPHWQRGQGWAGGTRVRPLSAVPLPPYADTR